MKKMIYLVLNKRSFSVKTNIFVPKHTPALNCDISALKQFIDETKRLLVITGAGISTESGIPDYRSEEVGLYARSNHRPVQYKDYLKSAAIRQRYWARNFIGWPRFSRTLPNATHDSLRQLELQNKLTSIVTQNVDNLHKKAGSQNVIELHGSAFRVVCLQCNKIYTREYIQTLLEKLNPDIHETVEMIRPDGDVEIPQEKIQGFRPPFCDKCGGIVKPDIVFFGDNVPIARVDAVRELVTKSERLLVLGSSLSVFSGYRIILQAKEEKKMIGIVNIGKTRADHLADIKLTVRCGEILSQIGSQFNTL